jgi:hypothetical protein
MLDNKVQEALTQAAVLAERNNQSALEPEHLLLVLLGQPGGVMSRLLARLSIPVDVVIGAVRSVQQAWRDEGYDERRFGNLVYSERLRYVLSCAQEAAKEAGGSRVGVEHVLLAMVGTAQGNDDEAGDVLLYYGINGETLWRFFDEEHRVNPGQQGQQGQRGQQGQQMPQAQYRPQGLQNRRGGGSQGRQEPQLPQGQPQGQPGGQGWGPQGQTAQGGQLPQRQPVQPPPVQSPPVQVWQEPTRQDSPGSLMNSETSHEDHERRIPSQTELDEVFGTRPIPRVVSPDEGFKVGRLPPRRNPNEDFKMSPPPPPAEPSEDLNIAQTPPWRNLGEDFGVRSTSLAVEPHEDLHRLPPEEQEEAEESETVFGMRRAPRADKPRKKTFDESDYDTVWMNKYREFQVVINSYYLATGAQEALIRAALLAERFRNSEIESEHLLLAMLEQPDGVVSWMFEGVSVPIHPVLTEVRRVVLRFAVGTGAAGLRVSQRLRLLLAEAREEAKYFGDPHVDCEHFLLAMANAATGKRTEAGDILLSFGIDTEAVEELIRELRELGN